MTRPQKMLEGETILRRQFALPAEDTDWLEAQPWPYELVIEGVPRVIVYEYPLPAGYTVATCAVNVRIEPGYPDAQIDMAYFYPALALISNRAIGAISPDQFDSKQWQRWSRHRTPANPWRPGIDNLSTHFEQVRHWLEQEARKK